MIDTSGWKASQVKDQWSLSKLNSFDCPYRGGLLHLPPRQKEPVGEPAQVGRVAHVLSSEFRTKWFEVGADIRHSNELEKLAMKCAPKEGATPAAAAKAVQVARLGINHCGLLPKVKPKKYWIEQKWAFAPDWRLLPDFFHEGTYYRAVGDFVWIDAAGALWVEDDKTGWADADPMQGKIYAFLASKVAKIEPDEIYIRHNWFAQKRTEVEQTSWAALETYVPEWINEQIARIKAITDWSPIVGQSCNYCGFKDQCPEYENAGKELVSAQQAAEEEGPGAWLREVLSVGLTSQVEAEAALKFVILAGDFLKGVETRVGDWVKEFGPVAAAGKVGEIREQSPKWDGAAEPVISYLLEAGVDRSVIWEKLGMTKTTLDAIVKAATPIAGSKDEKADAKLRRAVLLGEALGRGTYTERDPKFGIYKDKLV